MTITTSVTLNVSISVDFSFKRCVANFDISSHVSVFSAVCHAVCQSIMSLEGEVLVKWSLLTVSKKFSKYVYQILGLLNQIALYCSLISCTDTSRTIQCLIDRFWWCDNMGGSWLSKQAAGMLHTLFHLLTVCCDS
jgi:hypothetical protein